MENLAEKAGLQYVNNDEPGYRRKRWGRGFTYLKTDGTHMKDEQERERIDALVIPPAWEDVWICSRSDGHIQATGRDDKGRKQYIYHPDWEKVRDEVKYNNLVSFGKALPQIRCQVDADLRNHKLTPAKITALIISLLDKTLIRIGNEAYAQENHSFGLTTLQNDHIAVNGSRLHLSFPGKGGKQQEVTLRDRRLARFVRRCQELPGQHLFQYYDEEGNLHRISSTQVNDYLQQVTGREFTAKDFRTWGATVAAAEKLVSLGKVDTEQTAQKQVIEAEDYAAQMLGNTRAVCRQYYIHPTIGSAYLSGKLLNTYEAVQAGKVKIVDGLSKIETAVLTVLQFTTS